VAATILPQHSQPKKLKPLPMSTICPRCGLWKHFFLLDAASDIICLDCERQQRDAKGAS